MAMTEEESFSFLFLRKELNFELALISTAH